MNSTLKRAVSAVGRQQALDKLATPLQHAVSAAFAAAGTKGHQAQNSLNGVWLGHPLHPALTDLPIGFWTAALTFDSMDALAGEQSLRPGADLLLGAGVVTAVGAALSGLADWQFTSGEPRRVGLVHAELNSGALLLSIASLLLRRRGARAAGRGVFLAGYGLASISAYLGGHLVSAQRIGVDHAANDAAPAEFTPVLDDTDLEENKPRCALANGLPIVLVRQSGQLYALVNSCAHLGGPLAEGTVQDGSIVCPWHGSRFALADGSTLDGPSTFPQPTLATRIRDGKIEVRAQNAEPNS